MEVPPPEARVNETIRRILPETLSWNGALRPITENNPDVTKLELHCTVANADGSGGGGDAIAAQIYPADAHANPMFGDLFGRNHGTARFSCSTACSPSADFFARLGDAIGNSTHLQIMDLHEFAGVIPGMANNLAFLDGLKHNSSIKELVLSGYNLSPGQTVCDLLNSLGASSSDLTSSLTRIALKVSDRINNRREGNDEYQGGREGIEALKSILSQCLGIEELDFKGEGDGFAPHIPEILGAVTDSRQLKKLRLPEIGHAVFEALVPLLHDAETILSNLALDIDIDDSGIDRERVATVLGKSNSLETLALGRLPYNTQGRFWAAFSRAVCDKTSINGTYFSNHTLKFISYKGDPLGIPDELSHQPDDASASVLRKNWMCDDKKITAKVKVLHFHPDFAMQPLFEWEWKVLPRVIDWLEDARRGACNGDEGERRSEQHPDLTHAMLDTTKLFAIYQFIRGMPELLEVATAAATDVE